MTRLMRNRTFMLMLAFLAFMTFALGPDAWCPMQTRASAQAAAHGMAACHNMAVDTQPQPSNQSHGGSHRSCCKVCACPPGISAMPAASAKPPTLAAALYLPHHAVLTGAIDRVFNNKSSPRGPPSQL